MWNFSGTSVAFNLVVGSVEILAEGYLLFRLIHMRVRDDSEVSDSTRNGLFGIFRPFPFHPIVIDYALLAKIELVRFLVAEAFANPGLQLRTLLTIGEILQEVNNLPQLVIVAIRRFERIIVR
jgi:hypothetical protein